MTARRDLTGSRFTRLTVKGLVRVNQKKVLWECLCDCGRVVRVRAAALNNGNTRSCGCLSVETSRARFTTHGHTKGKKFSLTYSSWTKMLYRCFDPRCKTFKNYGAKGITVCDRWKNSFAAFLEDMGERPSSAHSIERIHQEAGYEPGNCRWATRREQGKNRTNNVRLTLDGRTMILADWSRELGINYLTLLQRVRRGWDDRKVLTTPVKKAST